MRLTVCLEGNTEGRVLASVDMEEILKQCKENSISKEAFEKMKSKSHRHGYRQGYNKAIDDLSNILKKNYDYLPQILSQKAFDGYIDEHAEQLKAGVENERY